MEWATNIVGESAIPLVMRSNIRRFAKSVMVQMFFFLVANSAAYPNVHTRTVSRPGSFGSQHFGQN